MDTQDDNDIDIWKFIPAVSHSGKIVATESMWSVEFWDTTSWEVVRYMDYESCVRIAFLLDKNQIAIFSGSFVTL